jgi:hypothetical protein
MTTIASQPAPHAATDQQRSIGLFGEVVEFFRQFIVAAFHPYRPEQHYMRGPGPACQAKDDPISHRHLI